MTNKNILLVDKEKNVLNIYHSFLTSEGYQVDIAEDVEEAIQILDQKTYSIVITELILRHSNALPLIEYLSTHSPETYIIMITAESISLDLYKNVIDLGVSDFFTKPFPVKNLLVTIHKGLKKRDLYSIKMKLEKTVNQLEQILVDHDVKFYEDKRYFLKLLRQELKRAYRFNRSFSLVTMDNTFDKKGTQFSAQDNQQKEKMDCFVKKNTRKTDIIMRNGESYKVLLPETTKTGTSNFISRLEEKLAGYMKKNIISPAKETHFAFSSATYPEDSKAIEDIINTLKN